MARRKISTRGRVVAAGVCVGVTGLLAGLMAATDDTGNASANPSGTSSTGSTFPGSDRQGSGYDGRFDADGDGRVGDPGDFSGADQQPTFPQPNTRSGGS